MNMWKRIGDFLKSGKFYFIVVATTCILGIIGYYNYYQVVIQMEGMKPEGARTYPFLTGPIVQTFFSTIRLFVGAFDAKKINQEWINVVLEIARWLAMFVAGSALVRLVKPLLAKGQNEAIYRKWNRENKRTMLIGNNTENVMIYNTATKADNPMVIVDTEFEERADVQKWMGYHFANYDALETASTVIKETMTSTDRESTIIINTHNEARNLIICKQLSGIIAQQIESDRKRHRELRDDPSTGTEMLEIEKRIIDKLNRLHVIVFGDQRYEEVYLRLQNESVGIIQYTNKYLLSAFSFVFNHPLTEHLPKEWLHEACVDPDVDFNVIMVGFGGNNQNLYSVHRAVNQFIQSSEGKIPEYKPVHYYICDKLSVNDSGLNHADFRYETDFWGDIKAGLIKEEEYLPLPSKPAITDKIIMDTNDPSFYRFVKDVVYKNPKSVNQIIICIGDDIDNIDIAQKMEAKKHEWGIQNLDVFVKIRDNDVEMINSGIERYDYIPYGLEKDEIFKLQTIVNNPISEMARKRNIMYTMEAYEREERFRSTEDIAILADYAWYTMDTNKQKSNIYAMLSLRFKLQLIGLDFMKEGNASEVNKEKQISNNTEYLTIYAKDDNLSFNGKQLNGMDLIDYLGNDEKCDFESNILRKNLTVQEHLRWCAYMISCGFVPASIKQIQEGIVKDYNLRIHGNLTTMEGLFEFRELMAKQNGTKESDEDVIKYDYQLMDEAWCFLHENGFVIYRME